MFWQKSVEKDSIIREIERLQSELNIAREKLTEIERKELMENFKFLERLTIEKDEFTGTIKYYSSDFEHNLRSNKISLIIYERNKQFSLYMKISYSGKDYFGLEHAYLNSDGNSHMLYGLDSDFDCDEYWSWEWANKCLYESDIEFIRKLTDGSSSKIRIVGHQYYIDRSISQEEIKAMDEVLKAYDYLKSK